MAKKKFRDITVDGVLYAWAVKAYHMEGTELIVWKDKKVLFKDHDIDDVVTPSVVAEKILDYHISIKGVLL